MPDSADLDQATRSMIQSLEKKTGETFDEWLAIARSREDSKHKGLVDYLKATHANSSRCSSLRQPHVSTSGWY